MNTRKTKAELRQEIEAQVDAFMRSGGEVKHIPRGQSGMARGELIRPVFHDGKPRQTRTDVAGLLGQIDARRHKQEQTSKTTPRRPKRKVIYDDFGEPIREVWE